MRAPETIWSMSADEWHRAFEGRDLSPVQVLEACLSRADAMNPVLNALVRIDRAGAKAAARASERRWQAGQPLGPLDGVPVTIKDSLFAAGSRSSWGSAVYRDFTPDADETPVARVREAGAVILGRTNVPEFTVQGYTGNPVFGATRNPWNTALTPGGSSGGAVACVAAGIGPVALGTDAGGSIRRPASHTGLVGLKPTSGRVPRRHGFPPIMLDLEVVGPMARTVGDLTAVMSVITAADPSTVARAPYRPVPPRLASGPAAPRRILFVRTVAGAPVDPEIVRSVEEAAANLGRLGHEVDDGPSFDLADRINEAWPILGQVGIAWLMRRHRGRLHELGPDIRAMAEAGAALPATAYLDVHATALRLREDLAALFTRFDAILTPTAAALPWPAERTHPDLIDGRPVGPRGSAIFTGFVNAAGCPAISVPCRPSAAGLPIGFQLVAPWGEDETLLHLAAAYEAAHPWPMSWERGASR